MSDSYNYIAGDEMLFSATPKAEPETCLGIHFDSAEDRRKFFREELRKKLKDPAFRAIDGFPIGEDEDIIALSDPPYYCACPNPWVPDFINEWENQKTITTDPYKREPFASDVSEGKNHPIYNAHSYHTKVPHKAIMKYILHYTNPGDIVYDGFCGTGMTGVAAQLCGSEKDVSELGYSVDEYGKIYENDSSKNKSYISSIGPRKSILNDLSSAASFISYNYNYQPSRIKLHEDAKKLEKYMIDKCSWMFKTKHKEGLYGDINYTVWSDVFVCPYCGNEIVFYESAVNENGDVKDDFTCANCHSTVSKKKLNHAQITYFDVLLDKTVTQTKQVPILINYKIGKKRFDKKPDIEDVNNLKKIDSLVLSSWCPTNYIEDGDKTSDPKKVGVDHVHQYYTKRNLICLSTAMCYCREHQLFDMMYLLSSLNIHLSKMRRWQKIKPGGTPGLPGTLFISSIQVELSFFDAFPRKLKFIDRALYDSKFDSVISVSSSTQSLIPDNSIDYIFMDPPFGSNLMYSELNYAWEAWMKILTNTTEEAIENHTKHGL